LLQRSNLSSEAKHAFRQAYPNAPDDMLKTAVFHTYIDGIEAAIDWLVNLELFLREPSHQLDIGVSITFSITSTIGISLMHCCQMGKQECWNVSKRLRSWLQMEIYRQLLQLLRS
jgi:hypothetical protein